MCMRYTLHGMHGSAYGTWYSRMRYLYHKILVSLCWLCVSSSRTRFRFHQVRRTQRRLQLLVLLRPMLVWFANKILSRHNRSLSISSNLHRHNCHRYVFAARFAFILRNIIWDTRILLGRLVRVCVCWPFLSKRKRMTNALLFKTRTHECCIEFCDFLKSLIFRLAFFIRSDWTRIQCVDF